MWHRLGLGLIVPADLLCVSAQRMKFIDSLESHSGITNCHQFSHEEQDFHTEGSCIDLLLTINNIL